MSAFRTAKGASGQASLIDMIEEILSSLEPEAFLDLVSLLSGRHRPILSRSEGY